MLSANKIIQPFCLTILFLITIRANAGVIISNQQGLIPAQEEVKWNDGNPSDDNACTIGFAASELQHYLRLITKQEKDWSIIPSEEGVASGNKVVLTLIKPSEAKAHLGEEGYLLTSSQTGKNWRVEIKAITRIGILYGAYGLLQNLGVRWFAPGEQGQLVPHLDLKKIPPLNKIEKPDFLLRGFHAWQDRGDTDFLLWMARNSLNYWCIQQSNKPLVYKLGIKLAGAEHLIHSWYLGATNTYPYNHPQFDGDEALPDDPYPTNSSYQGDKNEDGHLSYFEAHPEWFGLENGERMPGPRAPTGHGERHGNNFCTSNEDALTEFVKNAVEDLETGRLKHADMINAWLLDAATWCSCENCQALGTPTDRNLRVIHEYDLAIKAAQKVGRINRQIRLLFLTYNDVIDPPTKPLPKGFDYETCLATFFPINRCYVHKMEDKDCDLNAKFKDIFYNWTTAPDRHYKGQMFVGEYYNLSRHQTLPINFMKTMTVDIPFYYQQGARYFHYMHVSTKNWGNKALTNWQLAHQLWDVDLDVEALWNDYFSGRYGVVAQDMRRYYERMEDMLSNVNWLKNNVAKKLEKGADLAYTGSHISYNQSGIAPSLLEMRAFGNQARSIIDEVLQKKLPKQVRHYVEEEERLLVYAELTLAYYDLATQGFDAVNSKDSEAAIAAYKKLTIVAEKLKYDTTSGAHAGEHASRDNGLEATYGKKAVKILGEKIKAMED